MTKVTKHRHVFLTVLLVTLVLAAVPVSAQEPQPLPDGLAIELGFEEDGEWVANATLKGLRLQPVADFNASIEVDRLQLKELTPASLKTVFDKYLGLKVAIPKMSPKEVESMMDHGTQYLAARKILTEAGQELSLYENGKLLLTLQVSDEALGTALAQFGLAEFSDLIITAASMDEATVVLRFPTTGEEIPVSFEDVVEPVSTPPTNLIEAGATINDTETKTEMVSVAGITNEEISEGLEQINALPLAGLAPLPLAELNVEQVDVTLGRNGLEVNDNNRRWVKLLWDQEGRNAIYDSLPVVGDFVDLGPDVQGLIEDPDLQSFAESWVGNTEIRLSAYVDEEPQEGLPKLHVGQPIMAGIDEHDNLILGGVNVGALQNTGPFRPLLPIAAGWEGDQRELRVTVKGDSPLPYLFLEEDSLPKIGLVLSRDLPWEKAEDLLENTQLTAVVAAKDELPSSVQLDYTAISVPSPAWRLVPRIAVDREGHIGLGEPPTRISGFLEAVGVSVSEIVEPYINTYAANINSAGFSVDPNAVTLKLDAEPVAGIRWDSELRRNLTESIPEGVIPIPSLPFGLQTLIPKGLGSLLVENLVQVQWGSEIAVMDEIPESRWDPILARFGRLFGR
ncbi:MAG: hypothetical protein U9Q78_08325 [Chloroflexota bacterium]|nr:hypothetical protein [Chloroflexota bacterium]